MASGMNSGHYDTQQVCLNGHQQTDSYHGFPAHRRDFCSECGAKTIYMCPNCSNEIKGRYSAPGLISLAEVAIPDYCEYCGEKLPWSAKSKLTNDALAIQDAHKALSRLCVRFPLVVRQVRQRHNSRDTLDVGDEYDVQDLLHGLLLLFFDDVRSEEHTPSYAGKATRMDFLLAQESIVIEAKMTRKGLGAKEVGEQLIVDIAHYKQHPKCSTLYCLV